MLPKETVPSGYHNRVMKSTNRDKKSPLGRLFELTLTWYAYIAVAAALFYNWQYAKANGFISWMLFGEIVATLKGLERGVLCLGEVFGLRALAMNPLGFVCFLWVSHFVVLQIFRISTYHKYFRLSIPLLVAYGYVCSWLLIKFGLSSYFLPQLIGASIWLTVIGRKNAALGDAVISAWVGDLDHLKGLVASVNKTKTYYMASVVCYLVSFSAAFLYLYNSR